MYHRRPARIHRTTTACTLGRRRSKQECRSQSNGVATERPLSKQPLDRPAVPANISSTKRPRGTSPICRRGRSPEEDTVFVCRDACVLVVISGAPVGVALGDRDDPAVLVGRVVVVVVAVGGGSATSVVAAFPAEAGQPGATRCSRSRRRCLALPRKRALLEGAPSNSTQSSADPSREPT